MSGCRFLAKAPIRYPIRAGFESNPCPLKRQFGDFQPARQQRCNPRSHHNAFRDYHLRIARACCIGHRNIREPQTDIGIDAQMQRTADLHFAPQGHARGGFYGRPPDIDRQQKRCRQKHNDNRQNQQFDAGATAHEVLSSNRPQTLAIIRGKIVPVRGRGRSAATQARVQSKFCGCAARIR